MMRIVCPICGEEPKKGQRHICRSPVAPPRAQVELELEQGRPSTGNNYMGAGGSMGANDNFGGLGGALRRGTTGTSSTGVCSSIASLVSKNPALKRSSAALARRRGADFVCGVLALAISSSAWHREPKRELIKALTNSVADEAARAVQECWHRYRATLDRKVIKPVGGLGLHKLALPAPGGGQAGSQASLASARARPPPLSSVAQSTAPHTGFSRAPPPLPSPRNPETPRNKSNPRPMGGKGVPMNPLQALKQRRNQQQSDSDERRMRELQDAEEARRRAREVAHGRPPSALSAPPSPARMAVAVRQQLAAAPMSPAIRQASPRVGSPAEDLRPSAPMLMDSYICDSDTLSTMEMPMTPMERRRSLGKAVPSPHDSSTSTGRMGTPTKSESRSQSSPGATEPGASPPLTVDRWRSAGSGARVGSSSSDPKSATDRLRERLGSRQRGDRSAGPTERPRADTSGWQDRIDARKRETEECEIVEADERQKVAERSTQRNDAMRRVLERQAERQQDVETLEA